MTFPMFLGRLASGLATMYLFNVMVDARVKRALLQDQKEQRLLGASEELVVVHKAIDELTVESEELGPGAPSALVLQKRANHRAAAQELKKEIATLTRECK